MGLAIESGSQNASRLPGVYAYPLQSYSNQAIAPISRISISGSSFTPSPLAAPSSLGKAEAHTYSLNPREQRELSPANFYENAPYSNGALYKGLFLNVRA